MILKEQLSILKTNRSLYNDREFNFLEDRLCSSIYGELWHELKAAKVVAERKLVYAEETRRKVELGLDLSNEERRYLES